MTKARFARSDAEVVEDNEFECYVYEVAGVRYLSQPECPHVLLLHFPLRSVGVLSPAKGAQEKADLGCNLPGFSVWLAYWLGVGNPHLPLLIFLLCFFKFLFLQVS